MPWSAHSNARPARPATSGRSGESAGMMVGRISLYCLPFRVIPAEPAASVLRTQSVSRP
ncbi:Uncharacterised protein [Mycobacteroides abscessus subsp. abscessus]|nr:Uncharacterised protein [Mycobacteroides abscessus subsp. abscessus]